MTLGELLDAIGRLRVVVVGDLMLDEYIDGSATRISPEAPVMVVRQKGRRAVPGGAANVARNAAALGAQVTVVGVVGSDEAGAMLRDSLESLAGCSTRLVCDPSRATTRKTRVLAGAGHQVLRIDQEDTHPVEGDVMTRLLEEAEAALKGAQVLLLSDYMKGVLSGEVAGELSRLSGRPFAAVNAKPETAPRYKGLDLMSLNRSEMAGLVGRDPSSLAGAQEAAAEACGMVGVACTVATMGDKGLAAAWQGGGCRISAPRVEVSDVAGAGDTVIAACALGCAAAGYDEAVFRLAVQASSQVVRHSGVVAPSPEEVAALRLSG